MVACTSKLYSFTHGWAATSIILSNLWNNTKGEKSSKNVELGAPHWHAKKHILVTISKIQCFPGKSGRLDNISARIQPTDQMSMALLYPLELSIISGALYHLVATYSVKIPLWSCSGSATRANPKSQIWRDKIIIIIIIMTITIHFTNTKTRNE